LDYDSDGWMDILVVGTSSCTLYHNDGKGYFQDVTAQSGITLRGMLFGVAVGDYDNDGYPDLYITGYGVSALYHNDGKGHFQDVTAKAGVGAKDRYDVMSAVAFADLDNDGKLDLIVGRYILFTPQMQQLCDFRGVFASCGVKIYPPVKPAVYHNLGEGRFEEVTDAWGWNSAHGRCLGIAVRAGEPNGVAVYLANDEVQGDLFVKEGARWVNIGSQSGAGVNREGQNQAGMGTDWGDFDGDGKPDLVVSTFESEPKSLYRADAKNLYLEMGTRLGITQRTLPYVAWTAKFLDYDNDGWLDLLFTNGHTQDNVAQIHKEMRFEQPLILYHNEKGNLFQDASQTAGEAFSKPISGRGVAVGDFDNDGRIDLLVMQEEGVPLLLHNESLSPSHWLGIRLRGTKSNRDGIGTRVRLKVGSRILVREMQLAGGYFSAHDPRLLFGLGSATQIDSITVEWANGEKQTISNPPIDRYITLEQGKQGYP
jgi:hypothetical protein